MNNKKGFTLVELVVAVAIMLALATIATISVTNAFKKSNTQINDVQKKAILQAAKAYIIDNNITDTTIEINEDSLTDYFDTNDPDSPNLIYNIEIEVGSYGKIENINWIKEPS